MGPWVVRRLLALGHQVTIAHTGEHEADLPAEVEHLHDPALMRTKRAYPPELVTTLRSSRPDTVIDMYPGNEPDARLTVETFRGHADRLVAISSADVYRNYGLLHGTESGAPDPTPLAEDAPLREKHFPYGGEYEKILVERAVLGEPALPGTVLRLPMTYGPGDDQRRLLNMAHLKRMLDGRPAILLGEGYAAWRTCWGYVEDVAQAIALAATDARAAGRVYNVSRADFPTLTDFVRQVGAAVGWHGEVIPCPRALLPEHLRGNRDDSGYHDLSTDSSRIRRELGYTEVVDPAEGLRRTIAWERANPPELDPARYDYAAEDAALASLAR